MLVRDVFDVWLGLRELRFMDAQMADYRERWMFLSGVAMSWLAVPAVLQRELYALAYQAGGWTEGHTLSKLQAVFRTAHAAARGEKVQYAVVEVDPRYRFKNQTIIELLIGDDPPGVRGSSRRQALRSPQDGLRGHEQAGDSQDVGVVQAACAARPERGQR